MKLIEKIERVFAHRAMPDAVVDTEGRFQIDSDVEEALWFTGRDWHKITWQDWQDHSSAIYFFDRKAFASRFLGLNWAELGVLKEWLLQVCEYVPYKSWGIAASGPGDTFGRAFDTIDLLQKEVGRRHHASG